jgi:prepilin-type N-terminal cleavage/methylation domain-containing protein
MRASRRAGERGFSLLELMVAMAILSMILLGAALALNGTNDVAVLEATRNEMERSSQNALDRMALELRDSAAKVITVAANGSSIQFQVPVDLDGKGTILNSTGAVEYGFLANGVPTGGTITYRFVQNLVAGQPEVLSEAARRMQLNDDADLGDRFARGYILRTTQLTSGAVVSQSILTGRWIVQPDGNWGGDVDGDGAADPIFQLDGTSGRVLVNLWGMQVDSHKNRHFVRSAAGICFRNK